MIDRAAHHVATSRDPGVSRWITGVGDWLVFPAVVVDESEHRRVAAIRIGVALVVLWRVGMILDASRYYFGDPASQGAAWSGESTAAAVQVLLALALLAGLATRATLIAMVVTASGFDTTMVTRTLGTQILTILLFVLLLNDCGSRFSVDWWLRRRTGRLARYARAANPLRRVLGDPSSEQRRSAFLLGFVAYWAISIGGIAFHLADDYWLSGQSVAVMLESSYISRLYRPVRFLETHVPFLLGLVSIASGVGQTVFQMFMVPLHRWTWGRRFVIVWGAAFFVFSLFVLQLSYLPHIEILLWALIFLRRSPESIPAPRSDPPGDEAHAVNAAGGGHSQPQSVANAAFVGVLAISALTVVSTPPVSNGLDRAVGVDLRAVHPPLTEHVDAIVRRAGFTPPNVFNDGDLRMGDTWATIDFVDGRSGRRSRVPLAGDDGRRLRYHRSDVIYFGNALRWRRGMIDADLFEMHQPGAWGRRLIEQILVYDRRRAGRAAPGRYEISIYSSPVSDVDLPSDERFTARLVHSYTVPLDELP